MMGGKTHSRKNVNPLNCAPDCKVRDHCIEIKKVVEEKHYLFQCPIVVKAS